MIRFSSVKIVYSIVKTIKLMEKFSFGMITPSYAPDFARCRLLCESIDRCAYYPFKHYLVVDRQDLKLFQQLKGTNREIISVESILPWWIKKFPIIKNGWLSLKTIPIRNWLIQQIVKLAIAKHIYDEIFIFVDSDVVFISPFDCQNFVREGKVRLFLKPDVIQAPTKPHSLQKTHSLWCETASKVLNLPSIQYPTANYIGNIITWKREHVLQLHQHLENVSGRGWIETIANSWHISEYILYGMFVNLVLKEKSQHYYDTKRICHNYWKNVPMSQKELDKFVLSIPPEQIAVMISAKAGMPIELYAKSIERLQQNRKASKS